MKFKIEYSRACDNCGEKRLLSPTSCICIKCLRQSKISRGCGYCGDTKYLQKDEPTCDKCQLKYLEKNIKHLESNANILPLDTTNMLLEKYRNFRDEIKQLHNL